MKELNKRNTETVEQVLKKMSTQILEQEIRISGLLGSISNALARIETLEKVILLQKASSFGHGPSVK